MFTLICESLHAIFPMTSSEAEVKDFINGGKNTCKCKLHKCNFYKISYKNRYYDVQWWYQMVIPWCICYHIHISSNPCGTLRMPWYYRVSCQWTHGTIVYIYVSMMISDVHYIAEMQINVNNVLKIMVLHILFKCIDVTLLDFIWRLSLHKAKIPEMHNYAVPSPYDFLLWKDIYQNVRD